MGRRTLVFKSIISAFEADLDVDRDDARAVAIELPRLGVAAEPPRVIVVETCQRSRGIVGPEVVDLATARTSVTSVAVVCGEHAGDCVALVGELE